MSDIFDDPASIPLFEEDPQALLTIEPSMPMHAYIMHGSDPQNYAEANGHPEWEAAMNEEYNSLIENETWDLVPFHEEEGVAKAYDRAALKFWGRDAITNFSPARDKDSKARFMREHSQGEIVDMLPKHTYDAERALSDSQPALEKDHAFPMHFIPLIEASEHLREPFDRLLQNLCFSNSNRIVIVHDPILGWVQTVAARYGAPAYVFNCFSAYNSTISEKGIGIPDCSLSREIGYVLEHGWHTNLPRFEARNYVDVFGQDAENNMESNRKTEKTEKLLELAKLEFNIFQSIHKTELESLLIWWNDSVSLQITSSRHRHVEYKSLCSKFSFADGAGIQWTGSRISVLSAANTQKPSAHGKEKSFTKLPSSQYKGVVPQPNGWWGAQIYQKHQRVWLGTFNQEEVAARAYDRASIKFRGADAMTSLNLVKSHQEAIFLRGRPCNFLPNADLGTAKLLDAQDRFSIFSLVAIVFYSVYSVHATYDAECRAAATASSMPGPPAVVEGHVIELSIAAVLSRKFDFCEIDSG